MKERVHMCPTCHLACNCERGWAILDSYKGLELVDLAHEQCDCKHGAVETMDKSKFTQMLEQMQAIHDKKSADYSQPTNKYSNFERAAELASWFDNSEDKVFVTMVGIKLARIAELVKPGRVPNNESLEDSFLDLANYCVLWACYPRSIEQVQPEWHPDEPVKDYVGEIGTWRQSTKGNRLMEPLSKEAKLAKELTDLVNRNGFGSLLNLPDYKVTTIIVNHLNMLKREMEHREKGRF